MTTLRQQIIDLLSEEELSARDLSQALSIMEKEVYSHLEHIEKSLVQKGKKLIVSPCKCLCCGYTFESRKRLNKPGRCPLCKKGHISMAEFRIVSG